MSRVAGLPLERLLSAIAVVAVIYAVVLNAVTLSAPEPYGDEAWVGSAVWSFVHGHGLKPAIAVGSGIYDHTYDHWLPRIGIVPQVVADLVAGTSFEAYRAASLVISLIALAVFALGLRRRYNGALAGLAFAAVATTWLFVTASHYIRWDDVTLLWTCLVFTMLSTGTPPGGARAFGTGALIGIAPDFSVPTFALLPAATLVLASQAPRRLRTVGCTVGGALTGLAAYALLHFPGDLSAARRQYHLTYANAYRMPIFQALHTGSLSPIWRERERYQAMVGPFADSRTLIFVALACAVVAITHAWRIRDSGAAVGSLLLVSQLGGLALLYANRGPAYAIGAVPFAAAAVIEGLSLLPRGRVAIPAVALVAAIVVGGRAVTAGADASLRGAAGDARVSRIARSMLAPRQYAMGDFVYWWLYRNGRFRFNALLWADEFEHHVSFASAFRRACPAVVVYDDEWQARYPAGGPGSLGLRFPALAPTDPNEQSELMRELIRDYRFPPRVVVAGGRTVAFWTRRSAGCT